MANGMEPRVSLGRLNRMTLRTAPLTALIALAVIGCSSSGQDSAANSARSERVRTSDSASPEGIDTGIVTGRLLLVGGPARGFRATSGEVRLQGASAAQGDVDRRGHFEVAVDPGTYRVTGTSPEYGSGHYLCRATHPVEVAASETRRVNVFCQLK